MKDFTFWKDALNNAKTLLVLKRVGEEIAKFQNQTNFLADEVKLSTAQVIGLRNLYRRMSKKLVAEARPANPDKPEFKK